MKSKSAIIIILIIILSCSGVMLIQKDKIKTGIKILISQFRNSGWLPEEAYGYKYRLARPLDVHGTTNTKYPLLVFLHGASERGTDNRFQIFDLTHLEKLSSFVYAPQCPPNKSWNDPDVLSILTKTIDNLQKKYLIDKNRLYLVGYSMGGSGSYALAEQYNRNDKQNFAGIIRLAGQSLFNQQTHEIISKSAVWLHVGLKDTAIRIQAAETAFEKLTEMHPSAVQSSSQITIPNHPGTTTTLTLEGIEIAKLSKYTNDGHGINEFPFLDTNLMNWLFARNTKK